MFNEKVGSSYKNSFQQNGTGAQANYWSGQEQAEKDRKKAEQEKIAEGKRARERELKMNDDEFRVRSDTASKQHDERVAADAAAKQQADAELRAQYEAEAEAQEAQAAEEEVCMGRSCIDLIVDSSIIQIYVKYSCGW